MDSLHNLLTKTETMFRTVLGILQVVPLPIPINKLLYTRLYWPLSNRQGVEVKWSFSILWVFITNHYHMFTLPNLPYAYDALEPHIDTKTMETHHGKHHAWYTAKLNAAIEWTQWADKSIEEILTNLDALPADKKQAIINNGWGYYNHSLFWTMLSPKWWGQPTGQLADAIDKDFGSFDAFKEQFTTKAASVFGSGWAWLCIDDSWSLCLKRTSEQNSPLSKGLTPVLGIDVWEHAYYLNYQNRRAEYIDAFWNIVNREQVAALYTQVTT